jgi:putative lipoprotein
MVLPLLVSLAACGSGRSVESKALVPRNPGDLVGTHWMLVATHDSDAVPASATFTLDIDAGTASGRGPCNRYHLAFTHDGSDVTTGPVASTKIACATPLAAAERAYFGALERVDHADREGTESQLVLTGPHDVRLVYDRAESHQ